MRAMNDDTTPELSVICVYNDPQKLETYFQSGLSIQTVPVEVVLLDNTAHQFASAAEALNFGASQAKGRYLVFMHQDILLETPTAWQELLGYFNSGYSLIGVSGMRKVYPFMMSNVTTGTHDPHAAANWICTKVRKPTKVETFDECFFAMTREVYDLLRFDEVLCDNWHMYGVDLCLSAKERGISAWVVPIKMHHQSGGCINKAFVYNLLAVIQKHRIVWMAAPCYHFLAVKPCVWLLYYYWQLVYRLAGKKRKTSVCGAPERIR